MSLVLSFLILFVPAIIVAAIVRFLDITQPLILCISAMAAGSLTGWFISSAASAMSTAGINQGALIRTILIGLLAGLAAAGLVIFISQMIAKK